MDHIVRVLFDLKGQDCVGDVTRESHYYDGVEIKCEHCQILFCNNYRKCRALVTTEQHGDNAFRINQEI